jgi:pimeloyl-ACP methyl ester carboxylesterase
VDVLDADFHWQAAGDMLALLDALALSRVFIWGHSDGAVIGAIMSILQPARVLGLIFEGGHLYNRKPRSQSVFEELYRDPTLVPQAAQRKMAAYHGQVAWQQVIRNWAAAWLELGKREGDLYRSRLSEIFCPTLVVLGGQDEHTSIGEMEELTQQISNARLSIYSEAGHGVHDGHLTREVCTRDVREFMALVSKA